MSTSWPHAGRPCDRLQRALQPRHDFARPPPAAGLVQEAHIGAQLRLAAHRMIKAQIDRGLRHQGVECGIAGKAKNVVRTVLLRPVHRLDPAVMAVAAPHQAGLRPMAAQAPGHMPAVEKKTLYPFSRFACGRWQVLAHSVMHQQRCHSGTFASRRAVPTFDGRYRAKRGKIERDLGSYGKRALFPVSVLDVRLSLRPSAARDDRLGRCSSGVYDARSEYEIIVAISEDRGVQAGFPRPVLSAGCL